jgi:glycosyltransferase involved in cell wall biosynthesis
MKVLWITNTLFPDVCEKLSIETPVGGGWMFSSAKKLLDVSLSIQLGVASFYEGKELLTIEINAVSYFLIPRDCSEKNKIEYWRYIQKEFCPDVVHVHGTEYGHGLGYIKSCGNKNVVVSIQGLVSVYEKYYFGGIGIFRLLRNITCRDILRNDSIFQQKNRMKKRGYLEKKLISNVEHIIGRTYWDRSHARFLNSEVNYYFCNETLRDSFYKSTKWQVESCERYSIFLSQSHYPIKGLQQFIKALSNVVKFYPKTKVYIAGHDFFSGKGWRLSGYGKYINNLIIRHNLESKIVFTGLLSELEMVDQFIKSNVFICPSAIENSPNSLGEAQLLGVPCIASYTGGIPDMVKHNVTGMLYRYEEYEMLSDMICKIFSDDQLSSKLSKNGIKAASLRHDSINNALKISDIYHLILNKDI